MRKVCECGSPTTKTWCKPCGYKHRKRPSGLKYNIVAINKGWFEKGHVPTNNNYKANKGSFRKGEHRSPDTEFKKGRTPFNSGYRLFNGAKSEYKSLHYWVYKTRGVPTECVECGSTERLQWANISQQYLKDETDWQSMCIFCHQKYDWSKRKELIYA